MPAGLLSWSSQRGGTQCPSRGTAEHLKVHLDRGKVQLCTNCTRMVDMEMGEEGDFLHFSREQEAGPSAKMEEKPLKV